MTLRSSLRLVVFTAVTLSALSWADRKPRCSYCLQADAIAEKRKQTGTCADRASWLEKELKDSQRDFPMFDYEPYKALVAQCKADVTAEQDQRGALGLATSLEHLYTGQFSPDECITSVTGQCLFDTQYRQLEPERSVALIKELQGSPIADVAARFKKAQAELDALPGKLGGTLDKLAARAKDALDTARKVRKESVVVAEDQAQRGLRAAGYVLLIDPKHAASLKQKGELEKLVAELTAEREAFYANDFHKQHLGQVLFTADEDKLGSDVAGDFKTAFTGGEPLAGVAYLRYPVGMLSGAIGSTATVAVYFEVDGRSVGKAAWFVAPDDDAHGQAWTSFVAMPPSVKDTADIYTTSDLAQALAELPAGKHTVKVSIGVLNADGSKGVEAATGALEYDATTGQDKAKATADALAGRVLDEARMPAAEKKDPKLEKAMTAAANDNEFGDKVQRLVFVDRDFKVVKNWVGAILYRTIHAAVATKGKDGTCMVRLIEFTQQYQGKGYGVPTSSYPSSEFPIRCGNVNKK